MVSINIYNSIEGSDYKFWSWLGYQAQLESASAGAQLIKFWWWGCQAQVLGFESWEQPFHENY